MKKIAFVLAAAPAALALAACSESATVESNETGTDPAMTEMGDPAAAMPAEETMAPTDDASTDRVTIGEDGVAADVGDEDTRVRADVDGDPSLTVETE